MRNAPHSAASDRTATHYDALRRTAQRRTAPYTALHRTAPHCPKLYCTAPENAVAVEDSASGVGSASNAGVGLIVGYVGASHIGDDVTDSHARMLMEGTRADNGVGAHIVISDMLELPKVGLGRVDPRVC
eukprot:8829787-Pyramimonas_sp.AAC.1